MDGYSESLFSTDCIHDDDCSYASAFWVVIGLYGIIYVLLFVMEGEIELITKTFGGKYFNNAPLLPNKYKKLILYLD